MLSWRGPRGLERLDGDGDFLRMLRWPDRLDFERRATGDLDRELLTLTGRYPRDVLALLLVFLGRDRLGLLSLRRRVYSNEHSSSVSPSRVLRLKDLRSTYSSS